MKHTKFTFILFLMLISGTGLQALAEEQSQPDVQPVTKSTINFQLISAKQVNTPSSTSSKNFSDTDIKKLADEVNGDLSDEREKMLEDLKILWQASVEKSETIKFAIYKLSNPDGDKVKTSAVKKILSPLASATSLIGSNIPNPMAGGGAFIGGGLLTSALSDDSAINSKLSRVSDADLVLLTKEIDDLQQKLVNLYCNYKTSVKLLELSDKNLKNRYDNYNKAQNMGYEKLTVAKAFYKDAQDRQYKARQDFLSTRTELEQFVGNDALVEIEKNPNDRTSSTDTR